MFLVPRCGDVWLLTHAVGTLEYLNTFPTSGNRNEYSTMYLFHGLMTNTVPAPIRHAARHKRFLHRVTSYNRYVLKIKF